MDIAPVPTIQLTVVGCGTLGSALVDGIQCQQNPTRLYKLGLTTRREESLAWLRAKYRGAVFSTSNCDSSIWDPTEAAKAHLVVISAPTQFTRTICTEISHAIRGSSSNQPLVVLTVCPGITISQLQTWLPAKTPIVRSMPNTPVAVGQGATALFANEYVTAELMEETQLVLSGVSPCIEVLDREDLLDIVASVSGSGPAYLFYVAQALVEAGVAKGLPEQQAQALVIQSFMGASLLAQRMPGSLFKLLKDVCVPGGSTEKAVATLDVRSVHNAVVDAVFASFKANRAMGKI